MKFRTQIENQFSDYRLPIESI